MDPITMGAVGGGLGNIFGSVVSGIFGQSAGKAQAAAIRYAADKAEKTALTLNDRARSDVAPFRQFGVDSGTALMDLIFGRKKMGDFLQASDLFNFQEEIGTRNINRQLAARGLQNSGAGLETLQKFENQLVAEEGDRTFQRLFGVTQLGSNAAGLSAQLTNQTGTHLANMIANAGIAEGGAIGDGIRAMGNGIGGALQGGGNAFNAWSQNTFAAPFFDRMFPAKSAPLGPPTQATIAPPVHYAG